MQPPPAPPADSPALAGRIAPRRLWARLTPSQQQQVKQALIALGRQLLADAPSEPLTEETTDERPS